MADFVIFGAGKIARGFIAHLLFLSGYSFTFVEANEKLVSELNARGSYTVHVYGAEERNTIITGYHAVSIHDKPAVIAEMTGAKAIFTAVGGKNLGLIVPILTESLKSISPAGINVITCENWKKPAELLRNEVFKIDLNIKAGFAESVILRSAIEPSDEILSKDPLTVCVQDYWYLPVDADNLVYPLPEIKYIEPINNFSGFLERKFYTYNAANGTTSYLGALFGHTYLADAAHDERIVEVLKQVYKETGEALSKRFDISPEDQLAFTDASFKKMQDRVIVDTVERNARDPIRKLGPDDRLVGPAKMVLSYDIIPVGLATAIVAAVYYKSSDDDPSGSELKKMREDCGVEVILSEICKLKPDDPLYDLILLKEKEMKEEGWIV